MIDKTAIINAAQKFAAKGLIDKAVAEWEKLLTERNDGNIHNTIGDLYLKKGADQEAVKAFNKAAEMFKKDGFYPKAIAIYKKILNIAPNDTDTLIASAKLNADRGLTGNAIENYYRAVELYNREGMTEKAIMVVDKMLTLSSTNVEARAKIAYLYFRLGLRERAANEYASIASYCLEGNDVEKAKEYFDKSIEYDPANLSALIGISNLEVINKNHAKAFEALGNALSQAPTNKEVLSAYAKLALDMDRRDDAKKALITLKQLDPSSIENQKLLGSVYIKEGLIQNAWDELLPVIDASLDAERWSEAHELLHAFRGLQTIPVRQRLLRICKAQGDDFAIGSELRGLAALHENEGADEDALHLYKEALGLNADDRVASEKINALEVKLGIAQPSAEIESGPGERIAGIDTFIEEGTPIEVDILKAFEPGEEEYITNSAEAPEHPASFELNIMSSDIYAEKSSEGPSLSTGADDDLQALFAQFEKPEEQKVDYEAHYIAGLDFKQKGLLDEAIKELQTAAKDPDKLRRNSTMLALCYMEKKAYPLAVAEFTKILDTMTPDDSTYLHVKYELANAHMNNKEVNRALELYFEIFALDPDFKDVAAKMTSLKVQKVPAPAQEDNPRPKRDRVSYI
ncbi:MAG: tetratricopeptide repeat protein [Nitrospirae bacterium]|nr:tetratricopeptide repeat protein [Nitrospirota bacterium]